MNEDGHQRREVGSEAGTQTRERLLDAAEMLFASRGFAATSVRHVTKAAGCNLAAVNYHFGSKLGLYQEVFRRRMDAVREQRMAGLRRAAAIEEGPGALEAVLNTFASSFIEPLVNQSHGRTLTELIGREMLDPHLPPQMFRAEIAGPVQQSLTQALRATVAGLSEEAARQCVQSIVSQLVQAAQRISRQQVTPFSPPSLSSLVDHIVRFSAGGVRACLAPAP
ncbi:MAG TPA: CerR family C-terminal domain-containing protein [Thermoanaerobaculaceae bacterium]|nr:CerR family C-terminal domain-containing protein [Thermoanaerobaculaceae bacterium]HPS76676.1 CerR family C-terminal domain-containing protein [Thermoanaerobaculaceae bacterium]